ncbi:hypothetical protein SAMN02745126_04020 [Enhydrobacter aerosaccus]|uniref:Uncharacterized protein n=1 Tax=Enhydrobacter aerosaccus TaxID=225324 RepID=A0A1T4RQ90_9HYPH|nr:hypothetical protein [Enhydrobacter aerosaccus]SKA18057.1 hypothetical protein SAMN02745126_04020 [Enhydrobacter aerosaccus]
MSLTNSQVAHLWVAHARGTTDQSSARSSNGNFSFAGPSLYSYSTEIARFLPPAPDGTRFVICSTHSYSITTTSKHYNARRRALHGTEFVEVSLDLPNRGWRFGTNEKPAVILELIMNAAKEAKEKAARARSNRAWWLNQATHYAMAGETWAKAYGLPTGEPSEVLSRLLKASEGEAIFDNIRAFFRAYFDAPKLMWRNLANAFGEIALGAYWLGNTRAGYPIELQYRTGGPLGLPPTLLRVNGATVETSRGADFPLEHGLKALPFIDRAVREGRAIAYAPTLSGVGRTVRLGHFRIDSVSAAGWVQAGCHNVPHFAIRWAARQAGAIEAPELDHVAALVDYVKAKRAEEDAISPTATRVS